jgi:hypothetical protein
VATVSSREIERVGWGDDNDEGWGMSRYSRGGEDAVDRATARSAGWQGNGVVRGDEEDARDAGGERESEERSGPEMRRQGQYASKGREGEREGEREREAEQR